MKTKQRLYIYNSDFSSNAKIIYNNIELEYEYANLFNIEGVLEDLRKIADPDICEINNKSKLIKK